MRVASLAMVLAGCGRLGFDGSNDVVDGALDSALDPGIVELAHRGSSPCVRTGEGRLVCWGSNTYGQLGRGSIEPRGGPQAVPLENVVRIATGEFTSFAIDRDGALWGWGNNLTGQLGLGTSSIEPSPVRIPIPEPVVAVAGGQYHTCAITEGAGELYCWGGNECGALGTADTAPRMTPTKVSGLAGLTSIAIHDHETCVNDATGTVRCFGGVSIGTCLGQHLAPTPPVGLPAIRDVQGGCHLSMCATDIAGAGWCWGENISGNLGDGSATRHVDPLPVASISNVQLIGTGFDVSCAVGPSSMSCWGDNTHGQLGLGTSAITQAVTPIRLPFFDQMSIDQIEVGCATVCVRIRDGIYCWGKNDSGVIDDTTIDAFAPRRVQLPL